LWKARVELMRPGNALLSAVAVVVGLVVARDGALELATWVAAQLAAFLVAGFGNVLNDLRDARLDAKAHPLRPLPSGRITPAAATAWAVLLLGFGLWEAFLAAGWPTFAFAAVNAGVLGLYEWQGKHQGLPGNVLIGLLVASSFLFGALATGTPPASWGVLWLLAAMAFLSTVARELLKDIEDMDADRGERGTLPLTMGPGPARLLALMLVNVAVLLSVLAFTSPPPAWGPAWLLLLGLSDVVFLVGACLAWMDAGRAQRVLKLAMAVALAAFLAGPLLP
jgi:geranylgeranylglycerol-phosphate geranylgeranyltransferase